MQRLIPMKETLTVEFKSDRKPLSDEQLIDAVVAFANTDGGDLYLGVEDDGEITGHHEKHRDITQLAVFVANKTIPPQSIRVEIMEEVFPVIKISVSKSRSIVASSTGKIQRRQIKMDGTPENIPMYPYEINTRLSELSLLDYSAQPVPGASYDDLDMVAREQLRNIIRTYNGEKRLLELDNEELDKALQLVVTQENRLVPTYTGLLMIGKADCIRRYMPTAEAAYTAFQGTDLTANETFFLPLVFGMEKIFSFLDARNPEQELTAGLFRMTIPDFDKRAIREAIVNAFAHRDYTRLGRVMVSLSDDGLLVSNPGGFIEGVSIERILTVEPHGRNPVLADALKRIGLAERSGRGVDRIYEGSLLYGRPLPDYSETTSTSVKLLIPHGVPDKTFIQLISDEQQRIGSLLPINTLLILNGLRDGRRMSIQELAQATFISELKVRGTVERLAETGLVERVGGKNASAYILSKKVYQNKADYVRQSNIDSIRYHEMVLKLADAQGTITRKDVVELLRVSPPQAYRILQKMVAQGELTQSGTTRNVVYCR